MACLFFLLSMMPLKEGDIKIPFPDLSRHGKWEYKQILSVLHRKKRQSYP